MHLRVVQLLVLKEHYYKCKYLLFSSEEWISSPSPSSVPSSAPPMSPSPGSQNHNFNATNMSNGYASPMSTGSYDPYSPNGKIGEYNGFLFLLNVQRVALFFFNKFYKDTQIKKSY